MKEKTPATDQKVAHERNQENLIVALNYTALDTFVGQKDEQQICKCIDNLCRVYGSIVVLLDQ